jgi:hypothetical protein
VRSEVTGAGGRAWAFSALRRDHDFTEFVEWQTSSSDAIIDRPDVIAALEALNAAFPLEETDTWKEAVL